MPGDVVFVQVGQCGNEIGHEFWKRVCQEHGIAPDGTGTDERTLGDNCSTYFSSDDSERLIPRAVLIDLEPRVLNCISNSEYAYFYNAERIFECRDGGGAGNNWGSGYCAVQDERENVNEIGESIMNMIRSEVEICDKFDGFTLCHSIAGGTGSGLGSWILERLSDFFEEKAGVHTFSVFPGKSDVVVQPYNAALTISRLMEFSDLTFVLENEAITKTAIQKMHNANPSMRDVNEIIGRVMAGVTAPTRFGSPTFGSFNGISAQLSPVHPLHFVSCGIAPLIPANSRLPQRTSPIDLMQILEKPNSIMSTAFQTDKNSPIDCLISGLAIFQGEVSYDSVAQAVFKTNSHRPFGPPLLPFSDIDYCVTYPQAKSRSAVMAVNHSKFSQTLGSLKDDFTKMFKNGAYLTNFEKAHCFKEDALHDFLEAVCEDGISILTNGPQKNKNTVEEIGERIGLIHRTHFGKVFEVTAKPDASNMAYASGDELPYHTDFPSLSQPPELQMLHMYQKAAKGGLSMFVDGFKVAELMRVQYPEAFKILTTKTLEYIEEGYDIHKRRGKDHKFDFNMKGRHKVIKCDDHGNVIKIQFGNAMRSWFFDNDPEEVQEIYRALKIFTKLCYSEENQLIFQLENGETVLWANTRLLHARSQYTSSFEENRSIFGCYFLWDIVKSRVRFIRNKLGLPQHQEAL